MPAIRGVSYKVHPGEILGVVGESGCGKSITAMSTLGLLGRGARVTGGQAIFKGTDLLTLSEQQLRKVRGNRIAVVFQEPMTSLNPVLTIGSQIVEVLREHKRISRKAARSEATDLLAQVRIPDPQRRFREYPHQLSGGMRQRVMIAMALSCSPDLLIADEPTTALDVTIQAQILDLLVELRERMGMSIIIITHDLAVVAETCDRVAVMYAGRIVEEAPAEEIFDSPRHPYTSALLKAAPRLRGALDKRGSQRLTEIPGMVPSIGQVVSGCAFADRCPLMTDRCRIKEPEITSDSSATRHVACWEARFDT
ncbi:ABC transporter ATP-binding protein [Marinobacter salarius]|uniref:ABC transporter ATP-binding protein n=1 Tax=Marinobacter salarius TaxID=1420917 RepID=UPI0032ED2D7B